MGRLLGIRERDVVHEVPMPEAVGMAAFVASPHGWKRWWRSWMEGLMPLTLEPLHRGGAERQVLAILHVPRDALRPQMRSQRENIPRPLHDLFWYPSRRS